MSTPGLRKCTSNSDLLNCTVTTNCNPVRAFYELPDGKSTSAQIVKESRDWLHSVSTCRPFTPKDKTRSLLSTSDTRTGYRPPSAFTVTAKSFDPYEIPSKPFVHLEPIHVKDTNVTKQSKVNKIDAKLVTRKSRNPDDGFRSRHSAASSQSSGSMGESDSHTNSPRLELVGKQTRLIYPINVRRPVYSNNKSERCITPKSPNNGCNELQTELNKTKNITSKISPILPDSYASSNKKTTTTTTASPTISSHPYYHSPSQSSTSSSIDSSQHFRPNTPIDLFLLPNKTTLPIEEDKYQFRCNGIRSAVTGTSTSTEFTKSIVNENKPKSCGPHQRSVNYDVINVNLCDKFQTSASGDSGLSSVTELDHLINQLNELSLSKSSTKATISSSSSFSSCSNLQVSSRDNDESSIQEQYQKLSHRGDKVASSTKTIQQSMDKEETDHSDLITNKSNENEIIDLLNRIQNCISEFDLDGNRNFPNRSMLLKAVFDLINYSSARIHLAVARLILNMNVTGRNLLNICKLVYKVAKNADNDCLFLENSNTLDILIDALQSLELSTISISLASSAASPSTISSSSSSLSPIYFSMNNLLQNSTLFCIHLESLVFLTGTIKFLISNNNFMQKFLSNTNFLSNLMTIHKYIYEMLIYLWKNGKYFCLVNPVENQVHYKRNHDNDIVSNNNEDVYRNQISKFIQHAYHIIVQVTEIFCYLSSMDSFRPKLIANNGILEHIVNCIISYKELDDELLKTNHSIITTPDMNNNNNNNQSEIGFNSSEFYTIYFNWIRCLSHLTEHADVCYYLENWLIPSSKDMNIKLSVSTKPNNLINACQTVSTQIAVLCYALTDFIYIFEDKHELVVRIAYVLGNLAAKCERARLAIIPNQTSLLKLCSLCHRYKEIQKSIHQSDQFTNRTNSTIVEFNDTDSLNDSMTHKLNNSVKSTYSLQYDILVKLLRVIANVSISNTVGLICTTNFDCINLILEIINYQTIGEPNELLLNCFASLNNLTYYIKLESTDQSTTKQCEIAEILLRVISKTNCHQDEFLGIIRVFGNLTRHTAIRQWLSNNSSQLLQVKSLPAANNITPIRSINNDNDNTDLKNLIQQNAFLYLVIQALDSPRPDIVYSTLGVLINLMTDLNQRPMLRMLGGLSKLVEILRDFAGYDWQLAGLTCKTLWNYTELVDNSLTEILDQEIMNELFSLLTKFTDEEFIAQLHKSILSNSPVAESDCLLLWESAWSGEFLPFATELLRRLSNAQQ
ncbi:unnamed protein product [Schistosoma turkestanicum]|nr:unnamed protein product [Schistosoma turkestanicum]